MESEDEDEDEDDPHMSNQRDLPTTDVLCRPDGRCIIRAILYAAGVNPGPGVDFLKGKNLATRRVLFNYRRRAADNILSAYNAGGDAVLIAHALTEEFATGEICAFFVQAY